MDYLEFKNAFLDFVCVSTNQIQSRFSGFNNNNLTRWVKKELLIKLRNGYYVFPEHKTLPGFAFYVSNRIYRPSYISLHSALAFYGIFPEGVFQITNISSLKTKEFNNQIGTFSYNSVLPSLMFGYDKKIFNKSMSILLAQPEKAVLDLLYIYSFYDSEKEITALRFDNDLLVEIIDTEKLFNYAKRFNNKSLMGRVNLVIEVYGL